MDSFLGFNSLLFEAKCNYRIFDLSRRVIEIPQTQFIAIEQNHAPYPFPMQQKAQLAIAYWKEDKTSPWVWFLPFPLDERALLSQSAVGDFIHYLAQKMGAIDAKLSQAEQQALSQNPYLYSPADDKKVFFMLLSHKAFRLAQALTIKGYKSIAVGKMIGNNGKL